MKPDQNFQIYNASAGSGKTFTLVKEYLKILFKANNLFAFQHILAITFTNKAAAEMKERILENVLDFSKLDVAKAENDLFLKIVDELDIDAEIVQKKSKKIIKNILNNYGAFNITTIDSFTYKLIRSFAFDLGINLNFEVEMDAISLLNEAVDVLISRIGNDEELTKTLIDFAKVKANDDKSWDISKDLKEIAKLLLNENDILHVNKIQKKSINDFINLQKIINKQLKETEQQFEAIGKKGLDVIASTNLNFNDFASSDLPNHFKKMAYLNLSTLNFEGRLAKNIEKNHHQYGGKATVQAKAEIDSIREELIQLYHESESVYNTQFQSYLLNKLLGKSLIPLAVLKTINSVLIEIKEDNNIRLISEFNQLISKHLKEQPAAFIYEKIGERFKHYFIDEMQDTSIMQWENMIPLLDNVLTSENLIGETGTLLLVGDAKQAIYRWRGGKAEQFISLSSEKEASPFLIPKNIHQLDTNWRSYSEIIQFNNNFFHYIARYLQNTAYQGLYEIGNQQKFNTKKGGYVELQFLPQGMNKEESMIEYPQKVYEIIERITPEFDKKDICIITRTRAQGVAVAEYLTAKKIDIISSETLLLQNSSKVSFVVNLLNLIHQPENKEVQFDICYFLYHHLHITAEKHEFLKAHSKLALVELFEVLKAYNISFDLAYFKNLSLYENVEYIIRNFKLTQSSDAYLQFFLDVILDFSFKKAEGLATFLAYWEEKKDSLSIVVPSEKDAVQIMTIHKSKGLEFPVVIFPFDLNIYKQINPKVWYHPLDEEKYNGFESSLINYSKTLQQIGAIGEELYQNQQEELELDHFNLLYVTLTRAKEQLFIITEHRKPFKDTPKNYADLFIDFLSAIGQWDTEKSVYPFGNSERKSKRKPIKQQNKEQEIFTSSDWRQHNISIVPHFNTEGLDSEKARKFGNLIHKLLENIILKEDVNRVINQYVQKGEIPFEAQENIKNILLKVVLHEELSDYFTNKYTILNEREMFIQGGEILIPDRLIFNKNEVVILDYKTGKPAEEHHQQITNYAHALTQMNYQVTKKILVYIDEEVELVFV